MKCKQHPCERGVGVCASCLRERLLALILEQNGAAAHRRRGSDPPPPLNFPRSVSPSHRRSDASLPHRRHNIQRFFSTPQVGPASSSAAADYDGNIRNSSSGRFSVLSAIFGRHGSADSWLGSLLRGRKMKRKPRMPDSDERMAYRDRGMSPERPSPSSSEYLPESTSSPAWWRRPAPSPMRRSRAASGFAVCLSPLVWASPGGRRSVEAAGVSGELRRCPGSGPAVLVPNRSRKLTDLGRFK